METNSIIDDVKKWFNGLTPNGRLLVIIGAIVACFLVYDHIQEKRQNRNARMYAALDYIASQGSSINTRVTAGDQNAPQPGF